MSTKKLFFLLISISLIICHEANKTEEPKIETNETSKESNTINDEKSDVKTKKRTKKRF